MAAKRIVLTAYGTLGDLHPLMAVGLALQARGAHVTLASHPDYRPKVEQAGLSFADMGPPRDVFMGRLNLPMDAVIARMSRDLGFLYKDILAPDLRPSVDDLRPLIAAADVVIGSNLAYAAHIASALEGKPFVSASLMPGVFLSAWSPPFTPEAPFITAPRSALARGYNQLLLQGANLRLASALKPLRKVYADYGLPAPTGFSAPSEVMTLALYSPLLGGLQPDYPPRTCITGTPLYDSGDGHAPQLPEAVQTFLNTGPPPLVFSLGSVAVFNGTNFYRQAVRASAELRQRCVLLTGPESPLLNEDFGPEVCVTAYAPHSLLFPKARAVIHHGGIGSTAQALRSGRPILTTPVFADQFDNAHRIERLGAGQTLWFKHWSAQRAAKALKRLLAAPDIARRCAEIAPIITAENGAARAAEHILSLT
ncbi:MAG: glycosyltransferase [Asticcacaulis sp.]